MYEGAYETGGIAGGAAFYEDEGTAVFVGLTQGDPVDLIFGMDVTSVPTPELEIQTISGGFGVKAVIANVGDIDATDVDWSIALEGGLIILGGEKTGTEASIPAGETANIASGLVFGFGKPTITVMAESAEGATAEGTASGLVILFFVIGVS